jgi:hypothetical protein
MQRTMGLGEEDEWTMGLGEMVFGTEGGKGEKKPLMDNALHHGDPRWRSVFSPERKRRMNGIPILLNVMLPWLLFGVTFYFYSFRFHFRYGTKLPFVMTALIAICLIPLYLGYRARVETKDPMWFGYTAVTFALAVALGAYLGDTNYNTNMWFYYKYDSLEAYPLVDVGKELGVNVMDAGRVYFSSDSKIDQAKSWHFKDGTVYCVAPITTPSMLTQTLDFWAVGTDCCGTSSSDFRCGEYSNPRARSGLRVLDESVLPNYRLAVEQGSQLFHLHATNPQFYIWTQDPLEEVMAYRERGWNMFALSVITSLLVSVLFTFAATVRFAFIGREAPAKGEEDDHDHA